MTIIERLKIILAYRKTSQKEFARQIGFSENQISRLLNGKRNLSYRDLLKIVDVLNIPYECLVGKSPLFDEMLETLECMIESTIDW